MSKHSDNFNMMFSFFFNSVRNNVITFCGSDINIKGDNLAEDAKMIFKKYESGELKGEIITRHPNVVKSVITGKKGWGLWLNLWAEGITSWNFTEEDIISEFESKNIIIPKSMLNDFKNRIYKLKMDRDEKYFSERKIYF